MKLYYYPGACSLIPHIALEELELTYQAIKVDFLSGEHLTPEYRAINSLSQVPVLVVDEQVITQVPAILAYLALAFPQSHLMAAGSPLAFAQMQSFQMYIATTIHVLFRQISMPYEFADGEVAHDALRAKVPIMSNRYFELIEQRLRDGKPWVHGGDYSASDIYLFVFSSYLNFGVRESERDPQCSAHWNSKPLSRFPCRCLTRLRFKYRRA